MEVASITQKAVERPSASAARGALTATVPCGNLSRLGSRIWGRSPPGPIRVPIPEELIPPDAQVEMDAKKAAGYFTDKVPDAAELAITKGRGLQE